MGKKGRNKKKPPSATKAASTPQTTPARSPEPQAEPEAVAPEPAAASTTEPGDAGDAGDTAAAAAAAIAAAAAATAPEVDGGVASELAAAADTPPLLGTESPPVAERDATEPPAAEAVTEAELAATDALGENGAAGGGADVGAAASAEHSAGFGAIGPAWTRGEIEKPAGERNMGSWVMAVYTEEQQARLSVDAEGQAVELGALEARPVEEATEAAPQAEQAETAPQAEQAAQPVTDDEAQASAKAAVLERAERAEGGHAQRAAEQAVQRQLYEARRRASIERSPKHDDSNAAEPQLGADEAHQAPLPSLEDSTVSIDATAAQEHKAQRAAEAQAARQQEEAEVRAAYDRTRSDSEARGATQQDALEEEAGQTEGIGTHDSEASATTPTDASEAQEHKAQRAAEAQAARQQEEAEVRAAYDRTRRGSEARRPRPTSPVAAPLDHRPGTPPLPEAAAPPVGELRGNRERDPGASPAAHGASNGAGSSAHAAKMDAAGLTSLSPGAAATPSSPTSDQARQSPSRFSSPHLQVLEQTRSAMQSWLDTVSAASEDASSTMVKGAEWRRALVAQSAESERRKAQHRERLELTRRAHEQRLSDMRARFEAQRAEREERAREMREQLERLRNDSERTQTSSESRRRAAYDHAETDRAEREAAQVSRGDARAPLPRLSDCSSPSTCINDCTTAHSNNALPASAKSRPYERKRMKNGRPESSKRSASWSRIARGRPHRPRLLLLALRLLRKLWVGRPKPMKLSTSSSRRRRRRRRRSSSSSSSSSNTTHSRPVAMKCGSRCSILARAATTTATAKHTKLSGNCQLRPQLSKSSTHRIKALPRRLRMPSQMRGQEQAMVMPMRLLRPCRATSWRVQTPPSMWSIR